LNDPVPGATPQDQTLLDAIRLALVPGVGPLLSKTLLDHFGSPATVLAASRPALLAVPGVGSTLANQILLARQSLAAAQELALCRQLGVTLILRGQADYPPPLAQIPDPPSLLYVKGEIAPRDRLAIAIVGSRKSSPYGLRTASRLASALARAGFTIVSGLARGIDAAAHRAALAAGGRALGVFANGLASVYPPEHADLAAQVAAAGALVSESPMHRKPLAGLFTQRNRIISGLALGVIVVEAAPRSGTLSTARHALEQNREVFAVPGPVDSLNSRGCNQLIKDGARPVESADDVIDALGPLPDLVNTVTPETAARHPAEIDLSTAERRLLDRLGGEPLGVDELIALSGLSASEVMAGLSVLELKKLIKRIPGARFVRC